MKSTNKENIIKNVYDDESRDAINSFNLNILSLMRYNAIYKDVQLDLFTRQPIKPGSSGTQIRVDISKKGNKGFFILSEDFITRLNESDNIRAQLNDAMAQIKLVLKL